MDKNELFKSIGEVDETLLARTEEKRNYRPIRILAASLALIIGIAGLSWLFWPEAPAGQSPHWFAVTAYAENGEEMDLSVQSSCLNSGGTGTNIFGVDMPIFSFVLNPAKWEAAEHVYTDFDIVVSYHGKVAEWKDKQILVLCVVPAHGVEGIPTYAVTGWFEEPTDLTIQVVEEKSGKIVEEILLHVRYLPEEEAYELTVTDQRTN